MLYSASFSCVIAENIGFKFPFPVLLLIFCTTRCKLISVSKLFAFLAASRIAVAGDAARNQSALQTKYAGDCLGGLATAVADGRVHGFLFLVCANAKRWYSVSAVFVCGVVAVDVLFDFANVCHSQPDRQFAHHHEDLLSARNRPAGICPGGVRGFRHRIIRLRFTAGILSRVANLEFAVRPANCLDSDCVHGRRQSAALGVHGFISRCAPHASAGNSNLDVRYANPVSGFSGSAALAWLVLFAEPNGRNH